MIPIKILQIADLHIDVSNNINDWNEKIEALFNAMQGKFPENEDLVFCFLGDLIDEGKPDSFALLKPFFDRLFNLFKDYKISVEFVPGNHDLCENAVGKNTLEQYNTFIMTYVAYSYHSKQSVHIKEYEDIVLVLASSVSHNDPAFGAIDFAELKEQIEIIEKPFVVLTHHAPISAYDEDASAIRNVAALTTLMKSEYFIGFLHGHTHGYKDIRIENCQIVGVGPFLKNVPNVNNQLNLIDIKDGTVYTIDNYYYRADFSEYISAQVFKLKNPTYCGGSVYDVYQKILYDLQHLKRTYNLSLNVRTSLNNFKAEIDKHFQAQLGDATDMLKPTSPKAMRYNHGQYWKTKSDVTGAAYIIECLKESPTSSRAVLPLVNFENVVAAGRKDVLPALSIVQFSLDPNDTSTLNLTMYFRSLEVNHYLKVNLCEAYLLATEIAEGLPRGVKSVNLTIHAFVAQYYEGYKLGNKRSQIDMLSSAELAIALVEHQYGKLAELFKEKKDTNNYADITSIRNMSEALEAAGLVGEIREVLRELDGLMTNYIELKSVRNLLLDLESQELAVNRQMGKFIDILGQMENQ